MEQALYTDDLLLAIGKKIKLIVCDLDGTLLNSKKTIPPANMAAIRAARERGICVTICTGRIPEMSDTFAQLLEINGLYIAVNGAFIVDSRDMSKPYQNYINSEEVRQFLLFCAERGFDHIAATSECCYYSKGSYRIRRLEAYNELAKENNFKQIPLYTFDSDYSEILDMQVYKLMIYNLSEQELDDAKSFLDSLSSMGYTFSEPNLLDIFAKGLNKGTGIQNLARMMDIKKEEVCAFADYDNDIPMFDAAGLSVAMVNGVDALKNQAMLITGTNDQNGVAMAIERYILGV